MKNNYYLTLIVLIHSIFLVIPGVNAQWTETRGPYGGRTTCLESHQSDIYAGTSHGVFVSPDTQEGWTYLGLGDQRINKMAVNSDGIFACNYSEVFFRPFSDTTWVRKWSGSQIEDIVCDADNILVLDFNDGPYLSNDNGNTWMPVNQSLPYFFYAAAMHGGTIFVGSEFGLFRSVNSGLSWEMVSNLYGNTALSMAILNDMVFAGTVHGLYRSTDVGDSWQLIFNDYTQSIAVFDSMVLVSTSKTGPSISYDKGSTWAPIAGPGLPTLFTNNLTLTYSRILIGTPKGPFITYNAGSSWTRFEDHLKGQDIGPLDARQGILLAGTNCGSYISHDRGNTWEPIDLPGQPYDGVVYVGINLPYMYFSSYEKLYFLKDSLTSLDVGSNGTETFTGSWRFVTGNGALIKRYTADGKGIINFDNSLQYNNVNTIDMLATSGDKVYAGGSKFIFIYPSTVFMEGLGIFESPVDNCNWMPMNNGLPTDTYVRSFCHTRDRFFIATDRGIYTSPANPVMWQLVYADSVSSFTDIVCSGDSIVAVGTFLATSSTNVVLSPDLGGTWINFNEGVFNYRWSTGIIAYDNGRLYSCFGGPVVLTRKFGTEKFPDPGERKIIISPNPGQGIFTVKSPPDYSKYLLIDVVNVRGQSLFHILADPGGTTILDLSDYPSGIYIVGFSSENERFFEVQKICKF